MANNIISENELYEPMKLWLNNYLTEKYPLYDVITIDSHSERLDKVLEKHGVINEMAIGIDIQIDVLGIAKKNKSVKLFFIEGPIFF
jgi:ribosomal protein S16